MRTPATFKLILNINRQFFEGADLIQYFKLFLSFDKQATSLARKFKQGCLSALKQMGLLFCYGTARHIFFIFLSQK